MFAYGQTGSGKTHTMEGFHNSNIGEDSQGANIDDLEGCGIAPRTIDDIFKQAKVKKQDNHLSIFCSFLQIYNEKIFDLLNESHRTIDVNKHPGLKIRWNK